MKLKSSYIYIKGVRFRAYIGVSEIEREVGNDYVADLRLHYHIGKAMLTDDVSDTISLRYSENSNATTCKIVGTYGISYWRGIGKNFPTNRSNRPLSY